MRFSPSLSPLVVLLLLAFLWLILFVLLVWFAFRPRRRADPLASDADVDEPSNRPGKVKSRRTQKGNLETALKPDQPRASTPRAPPPPTVRVVNPAERSPDPEPDRRRNDRFDKDAFDDFVQPEHRRDDLDF